MTLTLDSHQSAAAYAAAPAISVRAGPGAGKTRVLVARVAQLLEGGVPASAVLVLAFTRTAAATITGRLRELVDELPVVTTFHGWAAGLCRQHALELGLRPDFTVQDREESNALILSVGAELGLPYRTPKRLREEPSVLSRYSRRMRESGRLDYDELETLAQELLVQGVASPYTHILVDEAQDTTRLEQQLLALMAPEGVFLVGDPSQALFVFRGAHPAGFWTWPGERLELLTNYRSTVAVVDAAQRLRLEPRPVGQVPATDEPGGAQVEELSSLVDDVALSPWGDCAILAPTWAQLDEVAGQLDTAGVPHVMARRGRLSSTAEGRRVVAVLRLLACPHDRMAVETLLGDDARSPAWRRAMASGIEMADSMRTTALQASREFPSLKILEAALLTFMFQGLPEAVDELADELAAEAATTIRKTAVDVTDPADLVVALLEQDLGDLPVQGDRVLLSTIHGAKGREWDHVWVLGCEEGGFRGSDVGIRRMLYVATTRARQTCTWVIRDGGAPSRFVDELRGAL